VPLIILGVFVVLALVAVIPLSIIQRYRMGTARRRARGWVATINVVGIMLSVALFLAGAAVTSMWVQDALPYAAAGLLTGSVLGIAGLLLTRWESTAGALYYTPNRTLVLGITLIVTARVAYGFWRAWATWRAGFEGASWMAASGLAGSMAAGAVVLGYYLVYWLGVRRRFRRSSVVKPF
jgi:hypothetical protein